MSEVEEIKKKEFIINEEEVDRQVEFNYDTMVTAPTSKPASDDEDGEDDKSNKKNSGYEIKIAVPKREYGKNFKNSSVYEKSTFIFVNMYHQIKNPVFIFYIFIIILESIPQTSPYPFPYTTLPYFVVIMTQMILDYRITFGVNKLDNIQNNKKVNIIRSKYLKMENSNSKNHLNYTLEK